ncbi:MAG: LCP family protein [Candidatus Limnocylindria bacterium]
MTRTWSRLDRRRWIRLAAVLVATGFLIAWRMTSASETPTPLATPIPTATALAPTPTQQPTPSPEPSRSPTPTPAPTPVPAGFEDGRLTVLVLGSDSDAHRAAAGAGGLTDAITVVSVREDGTGLTLISLPRDTADVALPDGSVWTAKLNALAPTLGAEVAQGAIGQLLDIQVDGHVQIDMDDLVRIVDALGAVSVDVSRRLADAGCTIAAGVNHLDGALALCYARHRQTDDDYARAGRHQVLLLAIRDAIVESDVDLRALVGVLGSLQTDLDLADVGQLVEVAVRTQGTEARHLVLGPPDYTNFVGIAGPRRWISTPNVAAIRASVAQLLAED